MINQKFENLKSIIKEMGKIVVAYSGGVDSAFLLKVAVDTLGDNAKGVLAISPTYPEREFEQAKKLAHQIGTKLDIIETKELENEQFSSNPINRCYFCKSELFSGIRDIISTHQYKNMVDGSNFDDLDDHRPGMKALREKVFEVLCRKQNLQKLKFGNYQNNLVYPLGIKMRWHAYHHGFLMGKKLQTKN